MALERRNIKEIHKINFHTQKGRNLGDTTKEILSSRTTSKSRFKSDTWPTCHPKRDLLLERLKQLIGGVNQLFISLNNNMPFK
jgi:hypothetical protein